MRRKIALIVRPPSEEARLAALRAAVDSLRREGHRIMVGTTVESGDARRMARNAARRGCDTVVAAGGDGTVNEVVNGLASAPRPTPLGVVPLGTANDFARGLGLPLEIEAALRVAALGSVRSVDVAEVNRRCFINVSTAGFGAEATQTASRSVKRRFGPLAYLLGGAQRLVNLERTHARFIADGVVVHDAPFVFFAVGNSSLTGGGTRVTPRADVEDGKLDIVLVGDVSRLDFLSLLPDLRAGTHMESPGVTYFRAHALMVEPAGPIPVNADGEAIPGRTYEYGVRDRPLEVRVPG